MGRFYNYEGSMIGSGIYAQDWSGSIYCATCDKDVEVDGQTDDYGNRVYATCPICEAELELDVSSDEDDVRYDSWKDNNLDD